MRLEKVILIITLCLVVILTLASLSLFILWRNEIGNITKTETIMNTQKQNIQAFVSQLQRCKTLEEIDKVLENVGVQRVID